MTYVRVEKWSARKVAAWSVANTWGSDSEFGDRQSYTHKELLRLAEVAMQVPKGGKMVEIGVYGGRSLSVLLLAARALGAEVFACDPLVQLREVAERKLREMLEHFKGVNYKFYVERSSELKERLGDTPIDLIHIDGDHADIDRDCRMWLPNLKSGGVAVFHDAIDEVSSTLAHMYGLIDSNTKGWETLWWAKEEDGHQLGRRKP